MNNGSSGKNNEGGDNRKQSNMASVLDIVNEEDSEHSKRNKQ
jgi:hypothetical protein